MAMLVEYRANLWDLGLLATDLDDPGLSQVGQ